MTPSSPLLMMASSEEATIAASLASESVAWGTDWMITGVNGRGLALQSLESRPDAKLHASRLADGRRLAEGRRRTGRVCAGAKVPVQRDDVGAVGDVEDLDQALQLHAFPEAEGSAHAEARAEEF